jgi:exonuclease III
LQKGLSNFVNCAKGIENEPTFWSTRYGPGTDDFCFATENLAKNAKMTVCNEDLKNSQDKIWRGLSDHCPIIVDFELS